MSQLEPPTATAEDDAAADDRVVLIEDGTVSLSVPADATAAEAAALATAIGAHVTDRQRRAQAAANAVEGTRRADQWVLADRMQSRGKRHWPRDVERGEEWRAAARSF